MKRFILLTLIINILFSTSSFSQPSSPNPQAQQLLNKSSHNFFIENKGQWPKEVRYLARIGGMNAWITNKGVVYDYFQITRNYKPEETFKLPPHEKDEFERKHTKIKGQVVDMFLEGANPEAKSIPSGMQSGYFNYFIGNDSTKWASYVRLYSEVLIQDIYPGIDIRYYFDNGLIRYDYIAKPGADLSQINLKIEGSNGYKINEKGELTLKTCLGKITHGKLYSYQQIGNVKTDIACYFIKNRSGHIGVFAENYNPSLALVIDPLVYSTFIGGSSFEIGNSIAIDGSGNAFITGYTQSINYPTTTGTYQTSLKGDVNVVVTKLNSSGSALIYSTYIGGIGSDYGQSIAIDDNGNAYVTGSTGSPDYPITQGAYQTSIKGGNVFITKLNFTGTALVYSTYIGGTGSDQSCSIAIDGNGNAYVTGSTISIDYPTTPSAFQTSNKGSNVFITKLNSTGTTLVYSTYIGGTGFEYACSIAINDSGNAYITGSTFSTDYPTTSGAYQTTHKNLQSNVFVTKLNTTGKALIYSTYIGGNCVDRGNAIAIDSIGNAYVTGYTCSSNYPTTPGAYQANYQGSSLNGDAFVTKLNSLGTALIYSTYIGGTDDEAISIAIDGRGNAFITGSTSSSNYPTTEGAYQTSYKSGYDAIVTKILSIN